MLRNVGWVARQQNPTKTQVKFRIPSSPEATLMLGFILQPNLQRAIALLKKEAEEGLGM